MNGLTPFETNALWAVLAIALLTIVYAFVVRQLILRQEMGSEQMQAIAGYFMSGCAAYLSRQVRLITIVGIILAALLAASGWLLPPSVEEIGRFGDMTQLWTGAGRAFAALLGVFFAYLVGQVGMSLTARGNVQMAAAARKGYNAALQAAYRSGSVPGLLTVGLGLLGNAIIFMIFGMASAAILLSFALGAMLTALVFRVSGGIYATATATGIAMASKGEEGIAADDPRNAATIASLLNENADNVAGTSADIFGSFEITLAVSILLGLMLGSLTAENGVYDLRFALFPLLVRGVGIVASVIGNALVRTDDRQRNARAATSRGLWTAAVLTIIGVVLVSLFLMVRTPGSALSDPLTLTTAVNWRPFLAALVGIVLAIVFGRVTEYFTSTRYNPVKSVSQAARAGETTSSMSGLALGFLSSFWSVVVIALALVAALVIYAGEPAATRVPAMLHGIALIATGMLALTASFIAMSGFGAVASNAHHIGQQQGLEKNPRNTLEDLQAVGATMTLLTRGVANGAAALSVIALLGALLLSVGQVWQQPGLEPAISIDLVQPLVLIGLLLGGALPLLFAALTLRSSARVAVQVADDVRGQFEQPAVMQRTAPPDYAQTVGIATTAIQRDLLSSGLIAVLVPVLIGFLLGVQGLGSFLGGIILSVLLLSVVQSNAGGAWTSARQYIEDGNFGGKNSEAHRAAVVTDMLGTPLKDTSGPTIIPLMKVSGLLALFIAPLVVLHNLPAGTLEQSTLVVVALCGVGLVIALWRGNRDTQVGAKRAKSTKAGAKGEELRIRH